MVSGLFRTLIWNQTIPDELRGRMAGTELLSSFDARTNPHAVRERVWRDTRAADNPAKSASGDHF